ncbi:MAG: hypothetical protein OEZ06_22630 [Myxococcales bacterium]|nr:hypothetical protein [Myxococcales bacterium]
MTKNFNAAPVGRVFEHTGLGLLLALGLWSAAPDAARAQECGGDLAGECPAGYQCESYETGYCSSGPCTPEGDCPEPICETETFYQCTRAACASQADCPDSMVCHEETYYDCEPVFDEPCSPDGPCEPAEPSCTETSQSYCTERYRLPCTESADCGEGFECLQENYWICDDSETIERDPATGEVADGGVASEPSCYEEASGYYYCQLLEIACDTDADCPGDLSCQDQPSSWSCSGGGAATPGETGAAGSGGTDSSDDPVATPADAGTSEPDPGDYECVEEPADPARLCAPVGYPGGGGPGGVPYPGGGTGTGDSGGSDGSGGRSGDDPAPTEPGDTNDGDESGDDGDHDGHGSRLLDLLRGKCSLSTPGSASGSNDAAWLLPASLLGLSLRRRRASR